MTADQTQVTGAAADGLDQHYRLLVENASDIVYEVGADGFVLWASPSVSRVMGWEPEDIIGRRPWDLVHPDDVPVAVASMSRVNATSADTRLEIRLRDRTGRYHWMSAAGHPVLRDGVVTSHVVGLRDVTDEHDARALMEAVFNSALEPHVLLRSVRDVGGTIVDFEYADANDIACAHMRMGRETLVGVRIRSIYPEPAATETIEMYAGVLESGALVLDDWAYPHQQPGKERSYDIRGVAVDSDVVSFAWRDVTDRHAAARSLMASEEQFRLVAENAYDVIMRSDLDGAITWVSPSVRTVLGWEPAEWVGRRARDLIHPEDVEAALGAIQAAVASGDESATIELRYRNRDGGWRWMRVVGKIIRAADGTIVSGIDSLRDIQSEIETRSRLAFERDHDLLTGLANRGRTLSMLEAALIEDGRGAFVLLCIEIDDLAAINEAFTHTAGDRVIVEVTDRLVSLVGSRERVTRSGDNEFCVLMPDTGTGSYLLDRLTRLQQALDGAVEIGPQVIDVTVSIGIALATDGDPVGLLRDATAAAHQARAKGGNRWEFLDPEVSHEVRQRLVVQTGLREALARGEVRAWFQPIVALADGSLRGYEALARWIKDDGTIVPPDAFIPVAEHTDLIVTLDHAMLRQALEAMAGLPADLHVAVNIAGATLTSPDLYDVTLMELARTRVSPQRLHLEVTETSLVHVTGDVLARMRSLAQLGVVWWVDDFGTGYSSIAHLRDMPVRGLKLDRSFTSGIDADPMRVRLAQGLVGLADGLGLGTVAEGVETEAEAAVLVAQGWQLGQGWLYGRPRPEATLSL